MERRLWACLAGSRLGAKFCRQMPIGPYFADFLCRKERLIVEIDGWSHDVRPERDAARDAYLEGTGYRVVRFTNADVRDNLEGVVEVIRQALALRPPRCD